MIPEIGHFALILAFCFAALQGTVPLWGLGAHGDAKMARFGQQAALAQCALISIAFLCLMASFALSDFSVQLVAEHSHSLQPLGYKLGAAIGNHEGSMVLWVFVLAIFGAAIARYGTNLPGALRTRILLVQAWIGISFLAFILFTSNPFLRLPAPPLDGAELNPLLQDLALVLHPPFLYLGYVGYSLAFSFAVAALWEGRVDAAWGRWVRPWTLMAWLFLTAGIALGSRWAYYELGWGGWWFWDPVENASFMPWLAGTALLHSVIVLEKRGSLKSWTLLLAIIAFAFSLAGTFLVRSGALTSVHSFANDPDRGLFILAILIITIGGALILYALRAPQLRDESSFQPISREGGLLLNNLFLSAALAAVGIGTFYPLILDAIGGGMVSVGPPYYTLTFVPIMVPPLVAVAIGQRLPWKRGDLAEVTRKLYKIFFLSMLAVIGIVVWYSETISLAAAFGLALGVFLMLGSLAQIGEWLIASGQREKGFSAIARRAREVPLGRYGMVLAHASLGVMLLGMVGDSALRQEAVSVVKAGDKVSLAGLEFQLQTVQETAGANYLAEIAQIEVSKSGSLIAVLAPERRYYPVSRQRTTEAAIAAYGLTDIYVALGEVTPDGGHVLRIYHKPLIVLLWLGAILMVVGGILSLCDRRLWRISPAMDHHRLPQRGAEVAGS